MCNGHEPAANDANRVDLENTSERYDLDADAQSKPGRGKYRQIFLNGFESVPLSSNPET